MKLHLESNIVEGTPEELVEYQRLVEGKDKDNDDEPLDYRYWYLEGININSFYVLKATANYFEGSKGKRYTYQAVSERVKPIDREDACKRFERAKDSDKLLRYYPTVDLFTHKQVVHK